MEIDFASRKVRLSVREFAEFDPSSLSGGTRSYWRAQLGSIWHKTIQAESPSALSEVSLAIQWYASPWTLEFQGRIDQIQHLDDGSALVQEIKSTDTPLPAPAEELLHRYPAHLRQLSTYLALLALDPRYAETALQAELIYVDIRSGVRQTVALTDEDRHLFSHHLCRLVDFLNRRAQRLHAMRAVAQVPPFPSLRPGQAEAIAGLERVAERAPQLFFQAPTGFGKTGIVLHYALNRLRDGNVSRVVYLTGKSTGQIQVGIQLRNLTGHPPAIRYFQLRNRKEHAIESPLHTCEQGQTCTLEASTSLKLQGELDPEALLSSGSVDLQRIRQLGMRTGICPYTLSRHLLSHADFWICDYNYVFAPGQRHILAEQPGYDPAHTLLIVDEAHNLPDRIAGAHSFSFSALQCHSASAAILPGELPARFTLAWQQWCQWLDQLEPSPRLGASAEYLLQDLLDHLVEALSLMHIASELLPPALLEQLWQLQRLCTFLSEQALPYLLWSPRAGTLHCDCLDAAGASGAILQSFAQCVYVSATLSPVDLLQQKLGLPPAQCNSLLGESPWRSNAYDIALDLRVDTRLRLRRNSYRQTAQSIVQLENATGGIVAVFFPSYQYAETVRTYCEAIDPSFRIAIQPRQAALQEQMEFLDEHLLLSHGLFFILGSSFAESIDALGGRVSTAMVVSPALPEVNPLQKARLQYIDHLGSEEAFHRVYRMPAMLKVNQALGRIVRAPGQRAKVALHCRRFAEPAFLSLLQPEYQQPVMIRNDEEWASWLQDAPSSSILSV